MKRLKGYRGLSQARLLSKLRRLREEDDAKIAGGLCGACATRSARPAVHCLIQAVEEKRRAEEKSNRYVKQLESALMSALQVAMTLVEKRDAYTAAHQRRVAQIAVAIGAELGFDEARLKGLRIAGYLHDVGKITIPLEILAKADKLSELEFQLIRKHPQAGYDVLKGLELPWPVAEVALQHHERIDGSGYPQSLEGEAIMIEARIIAVADVIDEMSSDRPYRPAAGIDAALAEITLGGGTIYDPDVAGACLRVFREKRYVLPG